MRRLRTSPLRTPIAIGLALLALAALAVAAWFLASTQSDQRSALRKRYSDRTVIAAALVDSLFRLAFTSQAQQASQQYGAPRISRGELDAAAKRQQTVYLMVVDASGRVIGASGRAPAAPPPDVVATALRSGSGVSAVRPGSPPTVASGIRFASPQGVRVLVSAAPLSLYRTFLNGTLRPLPTLRHSRAFVIDRNGATLGLAIASGRAPSPPSLQLLRAIRDRMEASYTVAGTRIFAAATQIPHTPWRIVSTAAEPDLYASVSGPRRWAPWVILIVGGLTLIAVAVLLRRLLHANDTLEDNRRMLELRATELERSNADLEQFAYAASHDLSEPLRTVAGFSELLRSRYKGRLDAEADEFIEHMVGGVARMQQLIDDLLLYSRVGREPAREQDVDLEEVLDSVLNWMAPAIEERNARVTRERLPVVRGEHGQLAQVLQNLIGNAIKFTDPAVTPAIHVSAERDGADWRIAVRDNGIGVDGGAEVIFKMFGRLHGVDAYPGTGIGLALAKRVIEGHGGRIWVEPAHGGGSVFFFTLPPGRAARRVPGVHATTA